MESWNSLRSIGLLGCAQLQLWLVTEWYSIHPVSIQYPSSIHPVSIQYPSSIHPVSIQYPSSIHPVSIQYPSSIHPVSIQYPSSIHPVSTASRKLNFSACKFQGIKIWKGREEKDGSQPESWPQQDLKYGIPNLMVDQCTVIDYHFQREMTIFGVSPVFTDKFWLPLRCPMFWECWCPKLSRGWPSLHHHHRAPFQRRRVSARLQSLGTLDETDLT